MGIGRTVSYVVFAINLPSCRRIVVY